MALQLIRPQRHILHAVALGLIALAFLGYVCAGHALHPANDGMKSMHGEGICLVVFALAAGLAFALRVRRLPPAPRFGLVAPALPAPLPLPHPPLVGARASPVWLQRFLR